jgi:predicted Zn-dependent protease
VTVISLESLQKVVDEGLAWVEAQHGVAETEVFASTQNLLFARLNYTSHIPCHGVEEPKSVEGMGVGLQVVFKDGDTHRVGFGSQSGECSLRAVQQAFEKALLSAVEDPDFRGLPTPEGAPVLSADYHDPELMSLGDQTLVALGWQALSGAVDVFRRERLSRDIIVGGDVSLLQERMAIAGSTGISAADETATVSASLTAMLESEEAKGSGWSVGTRLTGSDFSAEGAGRDAAESVIASRRGERLPSGTYRVILGPQAVADIVGNIILPSVMLSTMDASSSTFQGRLGQLVADPRFTLYDDGSIPGRSGSRRYTCEGLPTGRTLLIDRGRLVGFLANDYYRKKVLGGGDTGAKFGAALDDYPDACRPRNGFRSGESLGRNFQSRPSIVPTNVVIASDETEPREALMERVGEGLYIGRIWYTYPMNGLGPGDFTSTIVGDSFLIRGGKADAPLRPNTLRIHENVHHVLQQILSFGNAPRPVLLWGSPEVIYTPELALSDVHLDAIGQ